MNLPEKGTETQFSNSLFETEFPNEIKMSPSLSVSQHSRRLDYGRRQQGAGVLHAGVCWWGRHAPRPAKVFPTR